MIKLNLERVRVEELRELHGAVEMDRVLAGAVQIFPQTWFSRFWG